MLGSISQIHDNTRRHFLQEYSEHVGRNVILYATAWLQRNDPATTSIAPVDITGFMETLYGLDGEELDLIIHSPGGSGETSEQIISYLRKKFKSIRAIIPHSAMSAATMLACGCDEIWMGKQSSIGPIDPQFILQTPLGVQAVPAQAIMDQFEQAKSDCTNNPNLASVWYPILAQYGPGLLKQAENQTKLGKTLVQQWLREHMFKNLPPRTRRSRAKKAADRLSDHNKHLSHGRNIDRDKARGFGLTVNDLESDQTLQDLALTVYHATNHTFSQTAAAKIIENQNGRAFIILSQAHR
ncbi:MAG: serine protease [Armatimonadota bacterium]